MKNKLKQRVTATVMALLMVVGLLPTGLLGGNVEVKASDTQVAKWDFASMEQDAVNYQSSGTNVGVVADNDSEGTSYELVVDATSGKLWTRGSNNYDAQFSSGTIIYVPVKKGSNSKVTVVSRGNNYYYKVDGLQASGAEFSVVTQGTATSDITNTNVTLDSIYNYVPVVSTGKAYLSSITVSDTNDDLTTKYTITVGQGANGSATASAEYAVEGSKVYLTTSANPDYKFKEWNVTEGGVSITNNTFTMPANNVTITPVFEAGKEQIAEGTYTFGTYGSTEGVMSIEGLTLKNVTYNDGTHGLTTNGGSITLNLGSDSYKIVVTGCCYGSKAAVSIADDSGTKSTTTEAAANDTDIYTFTGKTGDVTLTFASGTSYIHSIAITKETPASSGGETDDDEDIEGPVEDKDTSVSTTTGTTYPLGSDKYTTSEKTQDDGSTLTTTVWDFSSSKITTNTLFATGDTIDGLYAAVATSSNKVIKDGTDINIKSGATVYVPIKSTTNKVTLSIDAADRDDTRFVYVGTQESGYKLVDNADGDETTVTITDLNGLVVTSNGQRYIPLISGGNFKAKKITLEESDYATKTTLTGSISNYSSFSGNGISKIRFISQTTEKVYETAVNDSGEYSIKLYNDDTYTAAVVADGYSVTPATASIELSGNSATQTKNVEIQTQTYAVASGTITITNTYDQANAISFENFAVTLKPTQNGLLSVKLTLNKSGDNTYTYSNAKLIPGAEYTVVLKNANDYTSDTTVKLDTDGTADIVVTSAAVYEVSFSNIVTSDKKTAKITSLTATNTEDNYTYTFTGSDIKSIKLRDGKYEMTAVETSPTGYTVFDHVDVDGAAVTEDIYLKGTADTSAVDYKATVTVGSGKDFATVNEALAYIERMGTRGEDKRVTVELYDELYREQIIVDTPYVTFVSKGDKASTLTWYYGLGLKYYSINPTTLMYDEAYAVDKYTQAATDQSKGKWGSTVTLSSKATGFRAENVIFENSFNRYVTDEEIADGNGRTKSTAVKSYSLKERACTMYNQAANQVEFKDCSFISTQDTIYTGDGDQHSYFLNCTIEGTTDFICGDGNPVFESCTLSLYGHTDQVAKGSYIVANKKVATYGYLFNNCTIVASSDSELKGTNSNLLGRAWDAGKITYFNTLVVGEDLIAQTAYADMNAKVANANYVEYYTHLADGSIVTTNKGLSNGVTINKEVDSSFDVTKYFGGWTPYYYKAVKAVVVANDGNGTAQADVVGAASGTTVTLKAEPAEGYTFKEWTVVSGDVTLADSAKAETTFTMPDAVVEVKAVFTDGSEDGKEEGGNEGGSGDNTGSEEAGGNDNTGSDTTKYEMKVDEETGAMYWFEDGVQLGTTGRGKEAYYSETDSWYFFDPADGGKAATSKDVVQPVNWDEYNADPEGYEQRAAEDGSLWKWVRYDSEGRMIKGWCSGTAESAKKVDNASDAGNEATYYFDPITGEMAKGDKVINNVPCYFDEITGIGAHYTWIEQGGVQYWYENGERQGALLSEDGTPDLSYRGKEIYATDLDAWCWLDNVDYGKRAVSKDVYQESLAGDWGEIDNGDGTRSGKWVRYDSEGRMIKGWSAGYGETARQISSPDEANGEAVYYFDETYGTMAKGTVTIDGVKYTFDETYGTLIK
jgi:pectin methylesterase-like acyl-CoA thioesterase